NKIDLISVEQAAALENILRLINPAARIVRSRFGRVALDELLNTGRFDIDRASAVLGWMEQPRGEETSETDEYGIGSFVFRARQPFHPRRLWDLLSGDLLSGVLRSKGFCWLASRHDDANLWSQAGCSITLSPEGNWWAAVPQDDWPDDEADREEVLRDFIAPYGDRRQEMVFIGIDMDQAVIESALLGCLLTDEEMALGPDGWAALEDPFPVPPPYDDQSADEFIGSGVS
ncbi:MAG: GTP-binding protein, partial [Planctomycetales bacterium]|nr:GTP-binding protein [Planctomycetales bacterium]